MNTTERSMRAPLSARLWAGVWGLASIATLWPTARTFWPQPPATWIRHTIFPDGGSGTQVRWATHPTLWGFAVGLMLLAALTAPMLALRTRLIAPAVILAGLSIVTASMQDGTFSVTLGAYLSLLGVACSALFTSRRLGWLLGALALVVPGAFALTGTVTMWSLGSGMAVSTQQTTFGTKMSYLGVYAAATALALGTSTALWLAARRRSDRQEVTVRTAEVDARAELARDLHDVVAHRMSLVAVRAETAPYSLEHLSPRAREAFADIAAEARGALDEMRTVLGVLDRSDIDGVTPGRSAGSTPLLTPQPDASTILSLIDDARTAGSPVDVVGDVPALDPLVGNTAYRVVQEALTNVRRHAPNECATVQFSQDVDTATIQVTNPCRDEPFEVGRGLAGMRERVERSGGMFHVKHETDAAGTTQFVVEATLPMRGTGAR